MYCALHPHIKLSKYGNCNSCRSKLANAKRHKDNPEYAQNIDHKSRYGISIQDKIDMIYAQGNKCAIPGCGNEPWHTDHDHKTGIVRGILCANCNKGLGLFNDSIIKLTGAIEYLIRSQEL